MMSSPLMSVKKRPLAAEPAISALLVDPKTVQALVTAGFQAIQRNNVAQANQIFEFLAIVRPNKDFVIIGLALTALTAGRFSEGEEILRTARQTLQDSDDLQAFHVLALLLCGCTDQARALQVTLASTAVTAGLLRFAKSLGQEINLHVTPPHGQWHGALVSSSVNESEE